MRKISGALLKETSFLRLATLALQILKLIHWFRPYNRFRPEEHWKLFVACANVINEVMIYAQNTGLIDAVPSVNIGKASRASEKEHAQHSTGSATSVNADDANSQH